MADIHSNYAALQAVAKNAGAVDAMAFAGDAVDYGPRPAECIDWLRHHATWAVRGNHDEALGNDTREMNRERVSKVDRHFLASLPLTEIFEFGGTRFGMVHAAPAQEMYHYLPPNLSDEELETEMDGLANAVDVIILGHTHLPLARQLKDVFVVNPGSVGQPKHGDARAAYAIWEDDATTLHRVAYPVKETIRELQATDLELKNIVELSNILQSGEDTTGETSQ